MIGFDDVKRRPEITSAVDDRLIHIDTTGENFYTNVLEYRTCDEKINKFIQTIKLVKVSGVYCFWVPKYAPSWNGKQVIFEAGRSPANDASFNTWKKRATNMPAEDGRKWIIGSEFQYYVFMVWLINTLVSNGWELKKALESVVLDSKELGHYYEHDKKQQLEQTGSREIYGIYDLANTFRYLTRTYDAKYGGCWHAGGSYYNLSDCCPLADIRHDLDVDFGYNGGVAWLILI